MSSWSDSFLNSVNYWSNITGIFGAILVAISVGLIFFTGIELGHRADARLSDATKRADDAHTLASQLEEKMKPKPFKDRLIAALNDIDVRIMEALKSGQTDFKGIGPQPKIAALQELCSDPESPKWITLLPSDPKDMALGFGPGGISQGIHFRLNPGLLK